MYASIQSSVNLFLLISALVIQHFTAVQSIGVNYGTIADNLPPPSQVAAFIRDKTTIDKVKIFDTNPDILRSFANTGVSLIITVSNADIPGLSMAPTARDWVNNNVKPFYPHTKINYVAVGSEVLHWGTNEQKLKLVPAMKCLQQALNLAGITDIKVTTPHSLVILAGSAVPSAARFNPMFESQILAPMLQFSQKNKSPFMVNPYPYFAYNPSIADFVLFRPNAGVRDPQTGIIYTNQLDMLMDSVYVAMKNLGYGDVDIALGETGWPSKGEPALTQCTVENARFHNLNVLQKVSSGAGTPLMPNRRFDTYIFGLFNENLKPGSEAEKNFGLFRPDFSPVYDIGIMRGGQAGVVNPTPPPTPVNAPNPTVVNPTTPGKKWCVPKQEASDAMLQSNLDYACSHGVDCKPIQVEGACFNPNNVRYHTAYAMNSYYHINGRNDFNCDFRGTGSIIFTDPSYGSCRYLS